MSPVCALLCRAIVKLATVLRLQRKMAIIAIKCEPVKHMDTAVVFSVLLHLIHHSSSELPHCM